MVYGTVLCAFSGRENLQVSSNHWNDLWWSKASSDPWMSETWWSPFQLPYSRVLHLRDEKSPKTWIQCQCFCKYCWLRQLHQASVRLQKSPSTAVTQCVGRGKGMLSWLGFEVLTGSRAVLLEQLGSHSSRLFSRALTLQATLCLP